MLGTWEAGLVMDSRREVTLVRLLDSKEEEHSRMGHSEKAEELGTIKVMT